MSDTFPDYYVDRLDLVGYIRGQIEVSTRAFGPPDDPRAGTRLAGVLEHMRREMIEVIDAPHDPFEWADLIILAIDGAWRQGIEPERLAAALLAKQSINRYREWPDWRLASPDEPIEHIREQPSGLLGRGRKID
jgi:hypothetical protein